MLLHPNGDWFPINIFTISKYVNFMMLFLIYFQKKFINTLIDGVQCDISIIQDTLIISNHLSSILPNHLAPFPIPINHYPTFQLFGFGFHMWERTCDICFSMSGLFHLPRCPLVPYILLQITGFHSSWLKIFHGISIHFLSLFICWQAPILVPYLSYCE